VWGELVGAVLRRGLTLEISDRGVLLTLCRPTPWTLRLQTARLGPIQQVRSLPISCGVVTILTARCGSVPAT
jgi:hypothetical protein